MKIVSIKARQILDSRGQPTVEADVKLDSGAFGRAAVPSGASTGVHEAHELRDGGDAFNGKGVTRAVDNVEGEIASLLIGMPADDQFMIDQKMIELDDTDNKARLGANAILAVSLAVAHAAADERKLLLYRHINDIAGAPKMTLPRPMMNVLNGGQHATNSADFQEFMIIPLGQETFADVIRVGAEIFQSLKKEIASTGSSIAVGDEGGFTYPVESNTEMLDFLNSATKAAGYEPGKDVAYALDPAASEFFDGGKYILRTEGRSLSAKELAEYLKKISSKYPVISIEDGLDQDDWQSWAAMTKMMGDDIQIVGDDLLVTSQDRLKRAIDNKSANAILIKPNQVGTLTETIRAIQLAKENNWGTVISHRSGETEDVSKTNEIRLAPSRI